MVKFLFMFLVFVFPLVGIAADEMPVGDFLAQVLQAIQDFGGLGEMAKIALVCMVLVSSMKVNLINSLLWEKLGSLKVFAAPLLSLVGGFLSGNMEPSWASVLTYIAAGSGAILFHQLLDGLKGIPGIGAIYLSIINFIQAILKPKDVEPKP